jgi:Putative zinc- or iron-chelating domain
MCRTMRLAKCRIPIGSPWGAPRFTMPRMRFAPGPTASPLATDEIEAIWRRAAAQIGFVVVRTADAYATSDGRGLIAIGTDDLLDADDAFAQLLFHELCHAITEGEESIAAPDWGLDSVTSHQVREHACLRFGAHLAARFGLRELMAPTTEYRSYYQALAADPLAADPLAPDPALAIGLAARSRFEASSWRAPLEDALARTAALALRRRPLGFPLGPESETCGTCAWMYLGGRGTPVERCRQSAPPTGDGARVSPALTACARWEPPVDCQTCGACCREAYHSVTISVRDPVVWKEPDLIVRQGHRFEIRREGTRCAALQVDSKIGSGPATPGYSCSIYDNRPRPCRDFAAGGRHCVEARRRVGLGAGPG